MVSPRLRSSIISWSQRICRSRLRWPCQSLKKIILWRYKISGGINSLEVYIGGEASGLWPHLCLDTISGFRFSPVQSCHKKKHLLYPVNELEKYKNFCNLYVWLQRTYIAERVTVLEFYKSLVLQFLCNAWMR